MLSDSKGGVAIIAAIVIPVLLLFLALAADIGSLHIVRSQLQTVADAGSLAGVTYSDEEIHVIYESEDDIRWDGLNPTHVRVYIELDSGKALQRARSTAEANLVHVSQSVNIDRIEYYLPREKALVEGKVFYWAEINLVEEGDQQYFEIGEEIEFDYMESEGANSYVVELSAEVSTILLGPLMSLFYGDESYSILTINIYSKSDFDHLRVFLDSGE